MKSYLVFSDIHGDKLSLQKLKKLSEGLDGVFFAGDGYSAIKSFEKDEIYAVGGNCDLGGSAEIVADIDGVRILLTHGHRYGVKSSLLSLSMRARELECAVAVFGHTHEPLLSYEPGVLLLNPGASSGYGRKNYAVMHIENGEVKVDMNMLK